MVCRLRRLPGLNWNANEPLTFLCLVYLSVLFNSNAEQYNNSGDAFDWMMNHSNSLPGTPSLQLGRRTRAREANLRR